MGSIRTFSGRFINPLQPDAEHICIEDIAHALSQMCRAGGHFRSFLSVAQHSVNCCLEAEARGLCVTLRLACLLHDAGEAYLSDITRPVKQFLPEYRKYEDTLLNVIWEKYLPRVLSENEVRQVFDIDDAMLWHEFSALMGEELWAERPQLHSQPDFSSHSMEETERHFLDLFSSLRGAAE
ncbi:MAG: phosphohydrolase [Pyramidobacter sp.]|nr:phosphohydrolase [Pyramidobacter sp.]